MSHLILQFTEIKKYKLRDNIQGEKPIFYIVENSENILKKLEEEIKKYIDQKIEMRKIVILTVKTEMRSILADRNKIGAYTLAHRLGEKGILFTTARKYKGLEAEVVIIVDIDKETFMTEERKRILHVAASRAKYFLGYIAHLTKEEKKNIIENLTGEVLKNSNSSIKEIFDAKIVDY